MMTLWASKSVSDTQGSSACDGRLYLKIYFFLRESWHTPEPAMPVEIWVVLRHKKRGVATQKLVAGNAFPATSFCVATPLFLCRNTTHISTGIAGSGVCQDSRRKKYIFRYNRPSQAEEPWVSLTDFDAHNVIMSGDIL